MKVKKLVSFILVVAMMLSVFVLPATAVNENEVVVHYYNENNWENPYIYYYNDGNTPVNWPGVAMNSDGDNWYSYTINNMVTAKVIFSNNGSNQYPAQNQEGLTVSGEKWYKSGSFFSQNPDLSKITVHYYNTTAWSNPYIYYYTDSANPITWPGVAMTSDGNGWYSYNIYGYDSAKVIFSDNGSNQNPGQNEPGYSVSGEKWYVNGSFYDSEPNGITVHFYNYDNWNNVNLYYYSGNLEGTNWTGNPMFADGDGWYSYKIYGLDEARVLFNNDSGIQIPGVMEEGFLVSDEMWYRNGTWTDERPDEITVYFYKPNNWSTANIYYYLNDNDAGPAWPGTAMTEVSDGWYVYHITRYASAKVMFNDGNNQIPVQNQPGLDASGVMWYKNGVWCDSETDTDEDELPDYMELLLGTNINGTDTDSDGLPDGYEVLTLGTDPLKFDSNGDNISDAGEDADGDELNNLKEYQLGTSPLNKDTDFDGINDNDEIYNYHTDPTKADTDNDTLSDAKEIELGTNPLEPDTDNDGILDPDEIFNIVVDKETIAYDPNAIPTLNIELQGNQIDTLCIKPETDHLLLNDTIPGYIGCAYDFSIEGNFESAILTFEFDSALLDDSDFVPRIYYYDEETQWLKELDNQTIVNNKISVPLEHFSKYILLNKTEFDKAWQEIKDNYLSDLDNIKSLDIALVIDSSGSMSWNDPYGIRKTAAGQYVDNLFVNDRCCVIDFDSSAQVLSGFTSDRTTLKNAISMIDDYGGTSLEDGVRTALDEFDKLPERNSNKFIILLTDGMGSYSSSLTNIAIENDIKIFTIGLGYDIDDVLLKQIASQTLGKYYFAEEANDLKDTFNDISQEIDKELDEDKDGIPDYYEGKMVTSTGILCKDIRIDTDPKKPDTDNDGLLDGEEVTFIMSDFGVPYAHILTDPRNPDTDFDGYSDGDEVKVYETDPCREDFIITESEKNEIFDENLYILSKSFANSEDTGGIKQFLYSSTTLFFGSETYYEIYTDILLDLLNMLNNDLNTYKALEELEFSIDYLRWLLREFENIVENPEGFDQNVIDDAKKCKDKLVSCLDDLNSCNYTSTVAELTSNLSDINSVFGFIAVILKNNSDLHNVLRNAKNTSYILYSYMSDTSDCMATVLVGIDLIFDIEQSIETIGKIRSETKIVQNYETMLWRIYGQTTDYNLKSAIASVIDVVEDNLFGYFSVIDEAIYGNSLNVALAFLGVKFSAVASLPIAVYYAGVAVLNFTINVGDTTTQSKKIIGSVRLGDSLRETLLNGIELSYNSKTNIYVTSPSIFNYRDAILAYLDVRIIGDNSYYNLCDNNFGISWAFWLYESSRQCKDSAQREIGRITNVKYKYLR